MGKKPRDYYAWLDEFDPLTAIGHTIRIYQITEAELREKVNSLPEPDPIDSPPSQ